MRCFIATLLVACLLSHVHASDLRPPIVPEGFVVDIVAREPMVSNACVMAFDRRGRIFVGQGPQWRAPRPDTPGDRVDILIDDDGDGIADRRKTFAEGFNCIQGLAWKGRDLWVANAPDLTIVRDLDGDDEADEYVRVYTGLGNLEHALHGLNFGPDGKLYMSKGNSKGYNRLDQLAPKAFRELWGLPSPTGAPDYTPIEVFKKGQYKRKYHTPPDDWGQQGGILRCDPDGRNLEIVSRGFRNPWDIAYDDGFNWLGTDNDQTQGDKIFAPLYGAHFGWGHAWSYHWTGEGHLPTVPASAPLFEGSGAGVIYYNATQFPASHRDVFYVNDWMRREVYLFRPKMDGALMRAEGGFPPVFAHAGGGRTLPGSGGRVFEPTDIEVGPDGALYILSWGHGYGGTLKDGKQIDAGRVYRIRYAGRPLTKWEVSHRSKPLAAWSFDQLFHDLASPIPAWRTDAQDELMRRGNGAAAYLTAKLDDGKLNKAQETWTLWTLGRMTARDSSYMKRLSALPTQSVASHNARVQAMRVLAHRARESGDSNALPVSVRSVLRSPDAVLRHEAVQAIWQARKTTWARDLIDLAATEQDRVVFYSTWNALRQLMPLDQRKALLIDERPGVRLAALLGLFQDNDLSLSEVLRLRSDKDARVSALIELWLQKTGGAKPIVQMNPPPGEYAQPVAVALTTTLPGARLTYTLDGSTPVNTSVPYRGPIQLDRNTTLRVAVSKQHQQAGRVVSGEYRIRHDEAYRRRAFISGIKAKSGRDYRVDWTGLAVGKRHYTDRDYRIRQIPPSLIGLPFMRTANNDDRLLGGRLLEFTSDQQVTVLVGVDTRVNAPLKWMEIGQPGGFVATGEKLVTDDPTFDLYEKTLPAGRVVLGANLNAASDSRRGHYIVIFKRQLLAPKPAAESATVAQVLKAMKTADPARGRELYLHPQGAGCFRCHRMEGLGNVFAPDLSDLGSRGTVEAIVRSILHPSDVITEGFSQQVIENEDGDRFMGIVLRESALEIQLAQADGRVVRIPRKSIAERKATTLSAMPDGFGKTMSAQQVADIVAWLRAHKSMGDRNGFSFRDKTDRIDIHLGEQRVATFLKRHPQLTRRALVNVTTPGGIQVTRKFPPRKPDDIDPGYTAERGIIHPVMHPGIWLGFGDIHGNDYWRLRAKVAFDGFVENPKGDRNTGSFAVRNRYLSTDGTRAICTEVTRYRFERVADGWLMRIDASYHSDDDDFYFGDQEESGLAVRVASPIRVKGGNGTILNDRGERNGAQVWGKPAKWFDYFSTIDGRQVGVMVVPDPKNTRPSWLHARDYGVVVTNPFPKQPRERREPYVKTWVKKGERFSLRYVVLIHDHAIGQAFDRPTAYRRALEAFGR